MRYLVGIDLGETTLKAGLVDENGRILSKESIKTRADRKAADIVRDMAYLAQNVLANAKMAPDRIAAIGIGSPGTPDNLRGVLVHADNLPFLNVPMRTEIRKILDRPVFLDNDANCAALAESLVGAASDVPHAITVTLGTGVSGGIVLDKRIFGGFNHAGGAIGHMVLVSNGEPCVCGRRGCFETCVSATALVRETRRAAATSPASAIHRLVEGDLSRVDAHTAFTAARTGDRVAQGVVDHYIDLLAEGLANLVNLLMPNVLVIGGEVASEGEALRSLLQAQVDRLGSYGPGVTRTEIRIANLGGDAGIIGAALMARTCLADGMAG
jgi:glucokinase